MDPVGVAALTRALVDIDSTTGRESAIGEWLAAWLRDRGYHVTQQPVGGPRGNLFATLDDPVVIFSTHLDCVPPFFPSREQDGILFGRGACDAKGALAAQVAAADWLRQTGERRVGLLYVVGEERGSDGARAAASLKPPGRAARYLVNGEPTNNCLASATRGVLRVKLTASGRAAHSSYPELGESAIEKLVTALTALRTMEWPDDDVLGRTHYTIGLVAGGVAPNIVPSHAEAEVVFRTVGAVDRITSALTSLDHLVTTEVILEMPPVRMAGVSGFRSAVFPYTSDLPLLSAWGQPLLLGPGSPHVAHTAEEHVRLDELSEAVDLYGALARRLLDGLV